MADAHTRARDANTISDSDKGARFAAELKLRARTHASGRARGSPGCRPAPPLGLHRPAASLERYGCCTAPVRCSRPSASEHSKKHSIHAECWAQGHFRRKSLEAPEHGDELSSQEVGACCCCCCSVGALRLRRAGKGRADGAVAIVARPPLCAFAGQSAPTLALFSGRQSVRIRP